MTAVSNLIDKAIRLSEPIAAASLDVNIQLDALLNTMGKLPDSQQKKEAMEQFQKVLGSQKLLIEYLQEFFKSE